MDKARTFIAIDISDDARREIAAHIDRLRRVHPDTRIGWERSEKLHFTVKFLGDTRQAVLDWVREELAEITSRFAPFKLRLARTGVFPSPAKARILWVGLHPDSDTLSELYTEIDRVTSGLGFKSERRDLKPHVTIGRVRQSAGSADAIRDHLAAQIEPVEFEVTELVLYESKLRPTGSVYSVIARAGLLAE